MPRDSDPATRQLSAEQLEQLLTPGADEVKTRVFRASGGEPATVAQRNLNAMGAAAPHASEAPPPQPMRARSVEPATVLEVQSPARVPSKGAVPAAPAALLDRLRPHGRTVALGAAVLLVAVNR